MLLAVLFRGCRGGRLRPSYPRLGQQTCGQPYPIRLGVDGYWCVLKDRADDPTMDPTFRASLNTFVTVANDTDTFEWACGPGGLGF